MRIVFAGSIGRFPVGGHAWVDMQYLLGLQALGHEVIYVEDCGLESWVYDWERQQMTTELNYPTTYLRDCLASIGFEAQWIYRAGEQSLGMPLSDFLEACTQADLLIVRGSPITLWREEYLRPKRRIYIDSDPGFTQIRLMNADQELVETLAQCDRVFTVGQCVGTEKCSVPIGGYEWLRLLPPVFLPSWTAVDDVNSSDFTTVMQWRSYAEVTYCGHQYGNKDKEFPKFIHLPKLTKQSFLIALTGPHSVPEQLLDHDWQVISGWKSTFTPQGYAQFVQRSRAEFAVAKQGYVAMRTGWFSDRSACYLASGRPILVQDTGQADSLPIGEGIFTFRNLSEAIEGIHAINADYERHQKAARKLAEEYFDSGKVLSVLLEAAIN
ncbi:glycosyltransferase family 1 protein [Cyanobacteria bacterium FACHB-63]|nr:glycosyltransferase family 1 protein [Cyanobacteria bacterium FACHB-63]